MSFVSKVLVLFCMMSLGSIAFAQAAVVIGKTNDPVYSDLVRLADGRVLACKPELEIRNGVLTRICREDEPTGLALNDGAGLGSLGAVLLVGVLTGTDSTTATSGTLELASE